MEPDLADAIYVIEWLEGILAKNGISYDARGVALRKYKWMNAAKARAYHEKHGPDATIEGCPCCFP